MALEDHISGFNEKLEKAFQLGQGNFLRQTFVSAAFSRELFYYDARTELAAVKETIMSAIHSSLGYTVFKDGGWKGEYCTSKRKRVFMHDRLKMTMAKFDDLIPVIAIDFSDHLDEKIKAGEGNINRLKECKARADALVRQAIKNIDEEVPVEIEGDKWRGYLKLRAETRQSRGQQTEAVKG